MGDFHKDSIGHNNHAITANPDDVQTGYEWLDLMNADTQFQVTANINKVVRVERRAQGDPANPSFWVLVSLSPALYKEVAGDFAEVDTFLELHDTPNEYAGEAGKVTQVNSAQDAIEYGQQLRPEDNPAFAELTVGGTGAAATDTSLDLKATDKAALTNRLTTVQRDALTPTGGMVIYNTTTGTMETYESGAWRNYTQLDEFIELTDTPASYAGFAGNGVKVNPTEDGLIFGASDDGDVVGPVSATNNAFARFDGVTGKIIQDSAVQATDAGSLRVTDTASIGGLTAPPTDVSLDLKSTDKALLPNRLTTAQRDALTPIEGMDIYNTDTKAGEQWNGTVWMSTHDAGGNVVGPAVATDNSVPTFDGTTGKVIKDSGKMAINPTTGDINVAGNMILGIPGPSGAALITPRDDVSTIQLSGSVTPGSAAYLIMDSSTKSGSFIATFGDVNAPAPAGAAFLVRYADNGGISNNLVVKPSGTGFGTDNPTAKVDISAASGSTALSAGTALTQWAVGTFDGGNNYLLSQGTAIPAVIGTQNNAPLGFFTNNTGRGQIAADGTWNINGSLGIGTTAPTVKLEVSSDIASQGRMSVNETAVGGVNNPGYMIHNEGAFQGGMFYNENLHTVEIFNSLGPQIIINEWGVGINKEPSINGQLSVNGIAKFTGGLNGNGSLISETDTLILGNDGNGGIGSVGVKDLKLGVGTLSPTSELHVVGNAFIDGYQQNYWGLAVSKTTGWDNANVSVQLKETDQSLQLNSVSTAIRDGYATPLAGMLHQNSDLHVPEFYNGDREKFEAVKSTKVVYVHSVDDLPTPINFKIYLEDHVKYIGDNASTAINVVDEIVFASNSILQDLKIITSRPFSTLVTDDFEIRDCVITYTGVDTLFDMPNLASVSYLARTTVNMTAAGTVFNIQSVTANTALIIENLIIVCNPAAPADLGIINDIICGITSCRWIYFNNGLEFGENNGIGITTLLTVGVNTGGTHLVFNGAVQNSIQINGFNPFVQASEHAFDFDTATTFAGVVTCMASTPNDPALVFAPTSYNQETVGFKFLGNANIPDSTAALHMNALNQAAIQTPLDMSIAHRIVANFVAPHSERFSITAWGNMVYLGAEKIKFQLNGHITGTTSTGTNVPFNFYIALNGANLVIDSFTDVSPGVVGVNTNLPHGYANGDRIIQENSSYDGQFVAANVSSTYYEIAATYIGTSIGFPAKVILDSKASNYFSSSADKIVGLNTLLEMENNDLIFLVVENTASAAEWNTSDIQAVLTKV